MQVYLYFRNTDRHLGERNESDQMAGPHMLSDLEFIGIRMELSSLLSQDRFQVFSGVGMQSNIGRQPTWDLVVKVACQI